MRPLLALLTCLMALPALAAPRIYTLDAENSAVAFFYDFGEDEIRGNFALEEADISIDFDAVQNSSVSVRLRVAGGHAGFPFATEAMLGPRVLDAANHPEIRFSSTSVRRTQAGASITGDLTIRNVTRPVTLDARLFRQQGAPEGSFDELVIELTGSVDRTDFGADGWREWAGDTVRLQIFATIDAE